MERGNTGFNLFLTWSSLFWSSGCDLRVTMFVKEVPTTPVTR